MIRHAHAPGQAGFSLVEMLAVVSILALVATLVVPFAARPADGLRLQAVARDLASALRRTRDAAIVRNAELVLAIDLDRRAFESPAVARRTWDADIAVAIKFAQPERLSRAGGGFRFFPDGSSTGGDVTLVLAGRSAAICVDWLTGAARLDQPC
jgi:general secretion pathway protein H